MAFDYDHGYDNGWEDGFNAGYAKAEAEAKAEIAHLRQLLSFNDSQNFRVDV